MQQLDPSGFLVYRAPKYLLLALLTGARNIQLSLTSALLVSGSLIIHMMLFHSLVLICSN